MKIQAGSYYQTRGGRRAFVEKWEKNFKFPWRGKIYLEEYGEWLNSSWKEDGYYISSTTNQPLDLVEPLVKEEETMDFSQPVQTREGYPVEIYQTDAPGDKPVKGVIKWSNDHWGVSEWDKNGIHAPALKEEGEYRIDSFDLVYQRREPWLKMDNDGFGYNLSEDMAELDLASAARDLLEHGWTRDEIKWRIDREIDDIVGKISTQGGMK